MSTVQEQYKEELSSRLAEWNSAMLDPVFGFADMGALLGITVVFPAIALIVGWFL